MIKLDVSMGKQAEQMWKKSYSKDTFIWGIAGQILRVYHQEEKLNHFSILLENMWRCNPNVIICN